MSFLSSLNNILIKDFANFKGRASRSEFWSFHIFILITSIILIIIENALGMPKFEDSPVSFLYFMFFLITLIPHLAVGTRRLHDGHTSGKWLALAVTGIGMIPLYIMLASKGDDEENEYGPKPEK